MENQKDYSELLRRAQSPAGQKLLSLLQASGGEQLQNAMKKASQGDFSQAKEQLTVLLDNPEAKKLLNELGGTT